MKNLKRVLALLLSVLMLVISVTACKKEGNDSKGEGNSSTDLKIGYWNSGYGSEWLEKFVEQFEKEYPQYNVILDMSASNESIVSAYGMEDIDDTDLYLCTLPSDKQYFEPLNDVLDCTVEGEDKTIGEKFKETTKNNYIDADGNYYQLPYIGEGTMTFVYNKKMFKEYGLSVPRTTGELGVIADSLLSEGIPAFCHYSGKGYWEYAVEVWYGQYEGYDYYYDNFYACTNEKGESPSIDVLLKKDGRYEVLKVMESLVTPEYIMEGSNSKNHTTVQTEFVSGKAAMMVNGPWLDAEVSSVGSLDDFGVFRVPVISSITDKLTTVKTEANLRKLITAIDDVLEGKKTEADYKVGEDYVIGDLVVSAADWEHVNGARRMVQRGKGNAAMIPTYSKAKEAAKDFLKFMYSDKGIQLIADNMQMRLPLGLSDGELDISGWNSFKKEFDNIMKDCIELSNDTDKTHPIFITGGAKLLNVSYIPYFCTKNSAERMTADTAWEKNVKIVNDNYRTNWLANIK